MRLVNVRKLKPGAPLVAYVGRRCAGWPGSLLGNPFRVGRDGDLAAVLARYETWLRAKVEAGDSAVLAELRRLAGLGPGWALGCWCADKEEAGAGEDRCHGDVIARVLAEVVGGAKS